MSGLLALLILSAVVNPISSASISNSEWELSSAQDVGSSSFGPLHFDDPYDETCVKLAGGLSAKVEWNDAHGYVVYRHALNTPIDLTRFDRVALEARGGGALLFVGFEDSGGDRIFYGPHGADGTNTDFVLIEQDDLKELDVTLFDTYDKDYPATVGSEHSFDFKGVRAVLLQISAADQTSTATITPIMGCADAPDSVEPSVVSPNFDGTNDDLHAVLHTKHAGRKHIWIASETDRPAEDLGYTHLEWGRNELDISCSAISDIYNGKYKLIVEGLDDRIELEFEIDDSHFWDYSTEPERFGLAAYVAGEHSALNDVDDFGAHFDRAFSQMSSWGLDAAIVLNLPVNNWREVVEAAEDSEIRPILHLWPLDELLLAKRRITERELLKAVEELDLTAQGVLEDAFGFYLADEPPEYAADNLGLAVKMLSALYPGKPVFSTFNRLPRMERLIGALPRNAVFAFDAYPIAQGDPVGDFAFGGGGYKSTEPIDYADYAAAVRKMSGGRRFIAAIQAHGWLGVLRKPTPQELSAMSWLAVSEGAESLVLFLYMDAHDFTGLVGRNFAESANAGMVEELAESLPKTQVALDSLVPRFRIRLDPKVQATLFSNGKRSALVIVNRDTEREYTMPANLGRILRQGPHSNEPMTIAPGGVLLIPRR